MIQRSGPPCRFEFTAQPGRPLHHSILNCQEVALTYINFIWEEVMDEISFMIFPTPPWWGSMLPEQSLIS